MLDTGWLVIGVTAAAGSFAAVIGAGMLQRRVGAPSAALCSHGYEYPVHWLKESMGAGRVDHARRE
jgi:hypothetical protein